MAMAEPRLMVGTRSGKTKVYNVRTGDEIKTLRKDDNFEVSALLYVPRKTKREANAALANTAASVSVAGAEAVTRLPAVPGHAIGDALSGNVVGTGLDASFATDMDGVQQVSAERGVVVEVVPACSCVSLWDAVIGAMLEFTAVGV